MHETFHDGCLCFVLDPGCRLPNAILPGAQNLHFRSVLPLHGLENVRVLTI